MDQVQQKQKQKQQAQPSCKSPENATQELKPLINIVDSGECVSVYENVKESHKVNNSCNSRFKFRHFILLIFAVTPVICFLAVLNKIDLCECEKIGENEKVIIETTTTEKMTTTTFSTVSTSTEIVTDSGLNFDTPCAKINCPNPPCQISCSLDHGYYADPRAWIRRGSHATHSPSHLLSRESLEKSECVTESESLMT